MRSTIRGRPAPTDPVLRERSVRECNAHEMALETPRSGFDIAGRLLRRRDLSAWVGSWKIDRATEQALGDQRKIDPDLW
jgi:hypothetical protein